LGPGIVKSIEGGHDGEECAEHPNDALHGEYHCLVPLFLIRVSCVMDQPKNGF